MEEDRGGKRTRAPAGIGRRGFLGTVGAGVVGAAVAGTASSAPPAARAGAGTLVDLTLTVNGRRRRLAAEPRWSLLRVLRDELGMTGTKVGCERGECGACTVLIDGTPRYSCLTPALEAEGHEVTTVEGLLQAGAGSAGIRRGGRQQCGYCTPGQ